jgi:cysteinyl-tRNA synthetase
MLWKPDPSHIMKWDSPWGTGYPGWHIECSTMALDLFGADMIDIHTGGEDLVFPHHECEIAQSRCTTGADYFARFWMHARFLLVEGKKMSKSKGTFYTVKDVLEGKAGTSNAVHPAVLRYELIRTHYRSNLNFTAKGLADSANAVRKLQSLYGMAIAASAGEAAEIDNSHPVLAAFIGALSEDLNIAGAIGEVFKWMGDGASDPAESLAILQQIDRVLGVLPSGAQGSLIADESDVPAEIAELCEQLDTARADKDYDAADGIRQKILDAGFDVKTTKEGTVATRKLG